MTFLGDVRVPNFRGADTSADGQYTLREGNGLGVLEFAGNETYGQIQGLTLWWLCTEDFVPVAGCPESVLRDTVIWHTSRYAYYGYPGYNYVFDGTKVYGDPDVASGNNFEFKSVFWFGDYGTTDLLVTNSAFYDTAGLQHPYFRDGSIRVENNFLRTRGGIVHKKSAAPGSCPSCDLPDADVIAHDNHFVPVAGQPLRTVSLDDDSTDPDEPRPPLRLPPQRPGRGRLRGLLPVARQRPVHRHAPRRRGLRLRHAGGANGVQRPLPRRLRERRHRQLERQRALRGAGQAGSLPLERPRRESLFDGSRSIDQGVGFS